jgi:hypothetical protein
VQTLPTISYPEGTYNLTQGVAVSIIPTEDMSQTYVSYSIEGCALPVGLSFNTATGAITGTPTVLSSYREYTITVTNVIGSASTKLILNVIKVFLAPPVFSDTTSSGMCLTEPSLAMRRKAEILQYKKNNANISRRQNFSLIAQGKGPYAKRAWGNQSDLVSNPNISGLEQQGNTIVCNSSGIICSPTSSSDVPGPVMDLCYNPNVPLVGYLQPTRTKVNIGFKWPQRSWSIGDMGFPVGKAGNTN